MRSPWRAIVALVLPPCLAFSAAVAPPEHVHEADAVHAHSIVHRHFEPHDFDAHDHEFEAPDHDGAEISHDEGRVIWLDDSGIQATTHQFPVPSAALTLRFERAPQARSWAARPADGAAPPHGPPRRYASLRAPPALPA